jgi:hypothetical protein
MQGSRVVPYTTQESGKGGALDYTGHPRKREPWTPYRVARSNGGLDTTQKWTAEYRGSLSETT